MKRYLYAVMVDENGATALEYGLIAVLLATIAFAAMGQIGQTMNTMYSSIAVNISTATY